MSTSVYHVKRTIGSNGTYTLTLPDGIATVKIKGSGTPEQVDIAIELLRQGLLRQQDKASFTVEHEMRTAKKVPVLIMRPKKTGRKMPLVIFQHGMTDSKEVYIKYGVVLAELGFVVVLPDARNHGERRMKNFDKHFSGPGFVKTFFNTVKGTVDDIRTLIDSFADDAQIDLDRIGMAGVSMGGFISFMSLVYEKRIKVAVPMIGSPDWEMFIDHHPEFGKLVDDKLRARILKTNPIRHADKLATRALLVLNGMQDKVVPVMGVNRLHKVIKPMYKDNPHRYKLIRYPGVEHEVTEEMAAEMVTWFKTWL